MELAEMKLVAENSRTLYELRDALNCAIEQLSALEDERDRLIAGIGCAELNRDIWQSAHDAIYAELQEVKGDRAEYELCYYDAMVETEKAGFGPGTSLAERVQRLVIRAVKLPSENKNGGD